MVTGTTTGITMPTSTTIGTVTIIGTEGVEVGAGLDPGLLFFILFNVKV